MPTFSDFPGSNRKFTAPEGHEADIETLHVHHDGFIMTSLVKFSLDEILKIAATGEIWVQHMQGNSPPFPMKLAVDRPTEIDQ